MRTNIHILLVRTAFWLAPLLMFLSDLSRLALGSQVFWGTTILFWLSFYAFLGVVLGLVQLLNYSSYAVISGCIAAFGVLIGITIIGMSRFAWGVEMKGVDPAVIISVDANPWVFFTSRFPGISFPVGLIMLVVGLKRKGIITAYLMAGLVVSFLLFPMGRIPGELIFNVIGDGLMVVFLGMLGRIYQRKMASRQEMKPFGLSR